MRVFTGGHAGSVMARRLLPALLMIPLLIAWLRLYGERAGVFESEVGVVLVALAYTFCLLGLIWTTARSVNETDDRRRRADDALRESEKRWATTIASIGDAVIATDVEGKIEFMNATAEGLTGWTLREASMRPATGVFNIINEQTRKQVESPITKVLREGMVVGLANHTILIRKDGTELPIDDSGAPIRDDDGKTMGVVLVFRDITEQKRAEESVKRSVERLDIISDTAGQCSRAPTSKIVDSLCKRVMEHLDCHTFFNFLVDEERICLRLNAYAGIPEETAREIHFLDFGVAVCGWPLGTPVGLWRRISPPLPTSGRTLFVPLASRPCLPSPLCPGQGHRDSLLRHKVAAYFTDEEAFPDEDRGQPGRDGDGAYETAAGRGGESRRTRGACQGEDRRATARKRLQSEPH